ncbi:MAG: 6-pyruvoyltetrahydropterin/6-carboxytetrahydropterin synthase [bacterium]|jgi:6-pyruvoyltetrahydropterin/6-carboxytetrahydropterin synthase
MIIRKLFKAEMAHRVVGSYTTRCQGLHGHSYLFEVFLEGKSQDDAQMLMDFKRLKEKYNNLLDGFDHTLVVWEEDKELVALAPELNPRYIILPYNTTAEQMARHIYFTGKKMGLPIHKIIVHETATGYAEFSGDDDITFDLDKVIVSDAIKQEWT